MESYQRRNETLEILTEWTAPIFGIIPAWTSVPIASLGWVIIYFYWTMKVSAATPLNQFGWLLGGTFAATTLAAGFRGFQFRRNQEKFVAARVSPSLLKQLSDAEIGKLLVDCHQQEGCTVEELTDDAAERGIDLVLWKDGQKTVVQYRRTKTDKVGVETVRELFGIHVHEAAQASILVTLGTFTHQARRFANGKPIQLVDGVAFADLARPFRVTELPELRLSCSLQFLQFARASAGVPERHHAGDAE